MSGESYQDLLKDYGLAVLIAVIVAFGIRSCVIEAYRIPSPAMRPTLESGDTIFVSKWPYGLRVPMTKVKITLGRTPKRGEVVIFTTPTDNTRESIRRVLGVAGDEVQMKKGEFFLNGKSLAKTAPDQSACGFEEVEGRSFEVCREPPLLPDFGPEKVPAGNVFVMPDLRSEVPDPLKLKTWGPVPYTAIQAEALWIWLSVEPARVGQSWFSRIRFERMLRSIH